MLWPSRDLQSSSRSKDSAGRSTSPGRRRRRADRLAERQQGAYPLSIESLEGRRVLAVTATEASGFLVISMDAANDQAELQYDGSSYTVRNGSAVVINTFPTAIITNGIKVDGDAYAGQEFIFKVDSTALSQTLIVGSQVETAQVNAAITNAPDVTLRAGAITLAANITTTGAQLYTGLVTLSNNTTLEGTTVTNSSTIAGGGKALSITGAAVVNGAISNVTNYAVSGTTSLGAGVSTTGTQAYTGAVTLTNDVTLAGTTPTFTAGVVGDGKNLTLDFSGTTAINGATFTGINNLTTDVAGTTTLTGALTTTGTQTYGDAVTLTGDATTKGTTVTFAAVTGDGNDLTVDGAAVFGGVVAGVTDLSVTGTTAVNAASITTTGTQTYTGLVTLGAATVTLAGTTPTFTAGVAGASKNLVLNFSGVTAIDGATFTGINDLSTDAAGTTTLTGAVTTTGTQTYGDAVTLLGATTLTGVGITLSSTVDGAQVLSLVDSGTTTFSGAVGSTTSLTSLSTNAGGTTAINGGSVKTTGTQTYGDAVTLGAATTLTGSTVTFGASSGVTGAANALKIAGIADIQAAIAGVSTLEVTGTSTVAASVSSSGNQTYGDAMTLGFDATLSSTTGTITLNGVTGSGKSLTVAGNADVQKAISGLSTLQITGTSTIAADVSSSGTQAYTGAVTLGADTTLTGVGITLSGTVNGAQALSLVDSGTTTFSGLVGGTTAPTSLSTDAGGTTAINGGAVKTTGAQTYGDAVTLGADTTLTGTTVTNSSTITGGGKNLTVTGDAVVNGAIIAVVNYAVSKTTSLGANVSTTGTQIYTGAVTLTDNVTLTGTTVTNSSTITGGGKNLTVTGDAVVNGAISGVVDYAVSKTTSLGAGVSTTGTQAYTGAVTLTNDVTLAGTTVTNSSTIAGGGKALSITGAAVVNGAISNVTNYAVSGTTSLGANVSTTGTQAYTGAVTLTNDVTLAGTTVTNSSTIAGGGKALSITGAAVVNGAISNVTNYAVSGTTSLGANVSTTGTQAYAGAVTLSGGDRTLTGTTVTNSSTITGGGGNNLTVTGNAVVNGAISGVVNYAVSGTSSLGANVSTISTQLYTGGVTLTDSVTLTGTTVTNSSTITGGGKNLTVTGDAVVNGAISGVVNYAVSGTSSLSANVSTTGTQLYTGGVTLQDNVTLMGTTVTNNSTITGNGKSLAIAGNAVVKDAISAVTTYSVTGTTTLWDNVTTTGTQTYGGAVTLEADIALAGEGITFSNKVDGTKALQINDSGTTTFWGVVGDAAALASLTTNAGGTTAINGGGVITTGLQTYDDAMTLGADTTLTGLAGTFFTIDGNNHDLTLDFVQPVNLAGVTINNVANLTVNSAVTLSGTITATGNLSFAAVTLVGNTVLDAGAFNVTFNSTVDSILGGSYTLDVNSLAMTTFGGAVGGSTPLSSLTIIGGGNTTISGGSIRTNGSQVFNNTQVTLANPTTFTGKGQSFAGNLNADGNDITFAITSGGTTLLDGGNLLNLAALTTSGTGTVQLQGLITSTGAQTYGTAVTLADDTTLDATTANIQFSSTVNGAKSLALKTSGTTTFAGVVGGVTPLASLTTSANGPTAVHGGKVATTGQQEYKAAVTFGNVATLTASAITFADDANAGANALTVTATTGAITANAPTRSITAPTLTLTAATGIDANTTVAALDAKVTGTGNIKIFESDGITLGAATGLSTTAGDISVTAEGGAITISKAVNGGTGAVTLVAKDGINQSGGITVITAGSLDLSNGVSGQIALPRVSVGDLAVVQDAADSVSITNTGSLGIGVGATGIRTKGDAVITASAGSITLNQPSDIAVSKTLTLNAPSGIFQSATGTLTGDGTVDARTNTGTGGVVVLDATGNTIANVQGTTKAGDFTYVTGEEVTIKAISTGGGDISISSPAGLDVTLAGGLNSGAGSVSISTSTGPGSIFGAGSISTSTGNVTLTTSNGGSITTPTIASTAGGNILIQTLTDGEIDSTAVSISTTGGGTITLSTGTAGGSITTKTITAGTGSVLLSTVGADASIDTIAGTITTNGGSVTASTGSRGDIKLASVTTNGGNQSYSTGGGGDFISTAGTLNSAGGTITATAAGAGSVTSGSVLSNGGAIRLEAGSTGANAIALQGNLSANTTGRITLASSGGIDDDDATSKVTAGQLVVERANGLVTLTAANNSIGALDLRNSSASGNNIVSGSPNLQIGVAGLDTNPGITTASGNVSIAVGGGNNITGLSNAVITLGSGVLTLEALRITLNQQAHNVAFIAGNFATLDIKTAGTLTVASGTRAAGGAIAGLRANGVAGGGGLIKITSGGGVGQENDAWIESQPIGLLSITATGAIDLPHPNNKVSNAFFSTPSDITYSDADALVINGINGNTSTKAADSIISAGGAITQSGAILSDNLRAGTTQGSIALTNSGNNVDAFSGQSGPSPDPFPVGVSFTDADDLTIGWAWGVGDFGITAGLDEVVDGEVISRRGFINVSVGGSIFIIDGLFYDTATAGSLVLRHGSGGSTDYVVSSPVDDGPRTLRQRIDYLNDNAVISPQNELITFNIDQFFPIAIVNALPTIERKVTIGPASVADPDLRIAIDGSGAADGTDGLTFGYGNAQGLGSNGSLIQGLVVYGFAGSGIVLHSSGNTVTNCWVGITRGSEVIANGVGIDIESTTGVGETKLASSNTITGNVVSGNEGAGIRLRNQATLNTITNNLIGTNAYGTVPIGNGGYGIEIIDSNLNAIGVVGQGNTIVNNGSRVEGELVGGGIKISGKLSSGADFLANTVLGNTIGNNTGDGILIDTSLGNVIGSSGAGNTIQDNVGAGIAITAARATSLAAGNVVQANTITRNDKGGIVLENTAFQTISAGNVVTSNGIFATNTGAGIELRSTAANSRASDNLIVGNFIGTESGAATDGGNAGAGILLVGAVNTVVGTATAGDGNVVSFNRRDGIRITDGVDATPEVPVTLVGTQNRIRGNTVRFNSGLGADDIAGITISGGTQNIVGGTNPGEGNVISDNKAHGVFISGAANKSYTDGNRVAGNTINANELDGVMISKSTYQSVEGGNVITANDRDGVSLSEGSTFSRVLGNRIGIAADGLVAGNARDGVRVEASTDVVIGSSSAANRNVIAGNGVGADGGAGIFVTNGSNGVVIRNNLIGLDANGGSAGNVDAGIHVVGTEEETITGVVIGGTATTEGNTISANGLAGLVLESTSGAIVRGNRIGTDIAGGLAIANSGSGIEIVAGENNVVGGTAATAANVISGNTSSGVSIDGGTGHSILGNRIGTNAAGTIAVANLAHGIAVEGVDTTVTIGGTASGSANTIAGNAIDGIHVADGQAAIFANYIGTNAASASTLGNQGDGIEVRGGEGTTIGDGKVSGRNVIAGNDGRGILLSGGSKAAIQGNFVGTNASGTAALANGTAAAPQAGIRIEGANGSSITLGNVVSGNSGNGIELVGTGTLGTVVTGNRVGTTASGAGAIANGAAGIALMSAGAADVDGDPAVDNRNRIGGFVAGDGNLISGNASHGIGITGSTNALVAQNTIGLGLSGAALGNVGSGVSITGSTDIDVTYRNRIAANAGHGVLVTGGSGNSIGADADQISKGLANGNTITSNKLDGVRIDGGATSTVVAANTIGGIGQGNAGRGITVLASSGNTIGGTADKVANGNLIVGNSSDGVGILNTPAANSLLGNTIRLNVGRGILVDNSDAQAIGGVEPGAGNTVVLNKVHGIELRNDADANTIRNNFIGTTSAFAGGLGNSGAGIRIAGGLSQNNSVESNRVQGNVLGGVVLDGAVGNAIGGTNTEENFFGNTIVLNTSAGIAILGNASLNTVSGNRIGTDAAGKALGNVGDGVSVQGSVGNMIGGVANGDGNTIRANQVGVNFVGAVAANLGAGNVVAGNTVDANLREGIRLFASSFNTIGDDAASNTITRNAGDGIALTIGSSANLVQGNTVGGATAADANKSAGIRVVGSNQNMLRNNTVSRNLANGIVVYGSGKTTIGGTAEDGNTIEANRGDGILLTDAATQTTILSNEVAANTGNGISVQRSTGNLIGTANAGNKVNANLLDGILVTSLSASTVIQANSIGGEAGANGANGIRVAGAFGTLIGGTLADDGNEIGENKAAGVAIATVASRTAAAATRVYGNAISNLNGVGIAVTGSTNQIIGGTASGQSNEFTANAVGIQIGGGSTGTLVTGNTIANSTLHGVSIVGSISNTISGNTINGSSGDGIRVTQAVAKSLATGNRIVNNILSDNTGAGVRLSASTQFTTIGAAGQRNVSNKNAVGVAIEGGSTNNLIDQNSIEANAVGIEINGSLTNVIRANTLAINGTGVSVINALAKSTAGGNQVVGNTIHESLGNGITIVGGGRHVIGGTAAGTANTITKSGSDGIAISVGTNGVGSVGNVIRGNYVGTNSVGTAGLGNAGGVSIAGGSGNEVSSGNVIRNNDGNGIAVSGSSLNTIGGSTAAAGNTISSNASNGVSLSAGSVGNLVAGNTISANKQAGVVVSDTSSQGNVIGLRVVGGSSSGRGNTISGNTGGGVVIDSAVRNQIFANFLTGNTSGGTADQTAGIVLLDGGNGNAVTPTLSRVTFTRRALTITGTVPGAVKGSSYWIDAFSNGTVGEVQANQPVGRVLVRIGLNGAFTATVTLPTGVFLPAGTRITMTATDTFGNTSGISAPGTVA